METRKYAFHDALKCVKWNENMCQANEQIYLFILNAKNDTLTHTELLI